MPLCHYGHIVNLEGPLGTGRQRCFHLLGHSFGPHPNLHPRVHGEADGA